MEEGDQAGDQAGPAQAATLEPIPCRIHIRIGRWGTGSAALRLRAAYQPIVDRVSVAAISSHQLLIEQVRVVLPATIDWRDELRYQPAIGSSQSQQLPISNLGGNFYESVLNLKNLYRRRQTGPVRPMYEFNIWVYATIV